jgi:hypothetical protein
MTKAGYVVLNGIGGMIAGAIGASFASGDHPVAKGALATGITYSLISTVLIATDSIGFKSPGVSGPPQPLRFP